MTGSLILIGPNIEDLYLNVNLRHSRPIISPSFVVALSWIPLRYVTHKHTELRRRTWRHSPGKLPTIRNVVVSPGIAVNASAATVDELLSHSILRFRHRQTLRQK